MPSKAIILSALLFLGANATAQSVRRDGDLSKFMGREVTITEPERDPDGFFPKGPASVCLEGPPQRQCYTAPKAFGNSPAVTSVQLDDSYYYLEDRYMTVRKYDLERHADVLASERQEILARLRRLQVDAKPQHLAPR
jgi:hypothetical protein